MKMLIAHALFPSIAIGVLFGAAGAMLCYLLLIGLFVRWLFVKTFALIKRAWFIVFPPKRLLQLEDFDGEKILLN